MTQQTPANQSGALWLGRGPAKATPETNRQLGSTHEGGQTAGARSHGAGRTGRARLVGGAPTSAGATVAGPAPTGKNRRDPLVGGRGYRAARLATLHLCRRQIDLPPPLPR